MYEIMIVLAFVISLCILGDMVEKGLSSIAEYLRDDD